MKIKKYIGNNETEAMIKVKEELGREALIVSVKRIKPRGFYKLFKKPFVEVTAALDDRSVSDSESSNGPLSNSNQSTQMKRTLGNTDGIQVKEGVNEESFIELLRELSRRDLNKDLDVNKPIVAAIKNNQVNEPTVLKDNDINSDSYLGVIYEQLLDNEVDEKVINQLMVGFESLNHDDQEAIDTVIRTLYNRIVKKISDVEPIQLIDNEKNVAVFVGPTGVGKTTTIAKIASYYTLNLGKKVGLITADTYRIAAVEQLRTYSNILNIPIKVVYNTSEMSQAIEQYKDVDLILVDTAGRSHRNKENQKELMVLLDSISKKEVFLVISLATKYNDLKKICDAYQSVDDYKLIFTKLDETSSYGNIINIKERTNAKLSYVTFGQNVPDDFSEFDVHEIAKKTLGGCDI
ncbi:MAG: flagellar biosynthesis protein FlhF [Vallitaleaceae bacterium]|nr:flagellar biosynthesis protein FlhF [Vallitaleaceae bacterium]